MNDENLTQSTYQNIPIGVFRAGPSVVTAHDPQHQPDWDVYPLWHKVLLVNRPGLKDPEQYLKPREITNEQKKSLESSLSNDLLLDLLQRNLMTIDPLPVHDVTPNLDSFR